MIKIKNSYSFFYHWHQRIGLLMCIAVIAWALSGLAHPVISRLNPKPAAPLPVEALNIKTIADFAALIEQQNIPRVTHLRLFQWQGQPVYRIADDRGVYYFSAETLTSLAINDFEYARALADYALGDSQAEVTNVQAVNDFDQEYLYINRYLPVVRVDYARADQPRVYIDPEQGRLATINDRRKTLTGNFFRALHSWTWISNITLRKTLMTLFLVAGFITALFGLIVWFKSWRRGMFRTSLSEYHPATRRWHRNLGALAGIFAMAFTASGLLHLQLTDQTETQQQRLPTSIPTQALTLNSSLLEKTVGRTAIEDVQLVQIDDGFYWRIKKLEQSAHADKHEHHHNAATQVPTTDAVIYIDAINGQLLRQGWQRHAQYVALALGNYPADKIERIELQQTFSGEYGFINKRLPVHAMHFDLPGKPTLYVETATNTLASTVTTSARLEGYTFAYLHKWHFADFFGKTIRDVLTSVVALTIILVLVLGVYRFFVRKK